MAPVEVSPVCVFGDGGAGQQFSDSIFPSKIVLILVHVL